MKTKSNLIIQMRTEKIGLAKFLHACKIPGFDHSNCFCEASKQMSEHVLMNCSLMPKRNEIWRAMGGEAKKYRRFMSTPRATKALTRWFIKADLLSMFSLAKNQLYWGDSVMWSFKLRGDGKTTWKRRVVVVGWKGFSSQDQ